MVLGPHVVCICCLLFKMCIWLGSKGRQGQMVTLTFPDQNWDGEEC